MTSPVIYYSRPGQREIGTIDILKVRSFLPSLPVVLTSQGPPLKLDLNRKGIQCLAVHPSKVRPFSPRHLSQINVPLAGSRLRLLRRARAILGHRR